MKSVVIDYDKLDKEIEEEDEKLFLNQIKAEYRCLKTNINLNKKNSVMFEKNLENLKKINTQEDWNNYCNKRNRF